MPLRVLRMLAVGKLRKAMGTHAVTGMLWSFELGVGPEPVSRCSEELDCLKDGASFRICELPCSHSLQSFRVASCVAGSTEFTEANVAAALEQVRCYVPSVEGFAQCNLTLSLDNASDAIVTLSIIASSQCASKKKHCTAKKEANNHRSRDVASYSYTIT